MKLINVYLKKKGFEDYGKVIIIIINYFEKKKFLLYIFYLISGMYSNMARNTIVNVSEIVCYDIVKTSILKKKLFEDNIYCHFTSASITGLQ